MLLPYALTTQALSATTANTIEGTKPYFTLNGTKLTNTSELAGFTYPDASVTGGIAKVDTSKSIEVNSSNVVLIPLGVKESDIVAAVGFSNPLAASSLDTLVKTTGYSLKIGDVDGDATTLADIGAKGEISVIMKKDGNIITPSATTLKTCNDYSIEVKISASGTPAAVQASTTYGAPNISQTDYSATIATYKLMSQGMGICYLAPDSLDVEISGPSVIAGVSYPVNDGHTSLWEYDPITYTSKGFIVAQMIASGKKFPQTGFKGAAFTVIGSGSDQSQYECVVSPATGITQSPATATSTVGKNCTIEYTSVNNPGAGMTISLMYSGSVIDTYTTPTPQLWAKVKGFISYNTANNFTGTYPAAELCGLPAGTAGIAAQPLAAAYFFTPSELTNARGYVDPILSQFELYIRDVSVTSPSFMGEWGSLAYNYDNSDFYLSNLLVTNEAFSTSEQYSVNSVIGDIYTAPPSQYVTAVCR